MAHMLGHMAQNILSPTQNQQEEDHLTDASFALPLALWCLVLDRSQQTVNPKISRMC